MESRIRDLNTLLDVNRLNAVLTVRLSTLCGLSAVMSLRLAPPLYKR